MYPRMSLKHSQAFEIFIIQGKYKVPESLIKIWNKGVIEYAEFENDINK